MKFTCRPKYNRASTSSPESGPPLEIEPEQTIFRQALMRSGVITE